MIFLILYFDFVSCALGKQTFGFNGNCMTSRSLADTMHLWYFVEMQMAGLGNRERGRVQAAARRIRFVLFRQALVRLSSITDIIAIVVKIATPGNYCKTHNKRSGTRAGPWGLYRALYHIVTRKPRGALIVSERGSFSTYSCTRAPCAWRLRYGTAHELGGGFVPLQMIALGGPKLRCWCEPTQSSDGRLARRPNGINRESIGINRDI